jgi:hypothetical protein
MCDSCVFLVVHAFSPYAFFMLYMFKYAEESGGMLLNVLTTKKEGSFGTVLIKVSKTVQKL